MKRQNAIAAITALLAFSSPAHAADCRSNILHIGGTLPAYARGVFEGEAGELKPEDTPRATFDESRTMDLPIPLEFARVDEHTWRVVYGPTSLDPEPITIGSVTFDKEGRPVNILGGILHPPAGAEQYGNTVYVDFGELREGPAATDIRIADVEVRETPCYEAPKRWYLGSSSDAKETTSEGNAPVAN